MTAVEPMTYGNGYYIVYGIRISEKIKIENFSFLKGFERTSVISSSPYLKKLLALLPCLRNLIGVSNMMIKAETISGRKLQKCKDFQLTSKIHVY